jgi:hypothetical protein
MPKAADFLGLWVEAHVSRIQRPFAVLYLKKLQSD